VVRNSDAQIAWYDAALRGDFIKAEKAESFKELEEKIDAQREDKEKPKKKPPPRRPAAGAPAFTPPPSSGPRVLVNDAPPPVSSHAESRLVTGAGTEYMAMSPFATGELKLPTVRSPPNAKSPPAAPPPPPPPGAAAGFGSGVHAAPISMPSPSFAPTSNPWSGAPAGPISAAAVPAATKPKSSLGLVVVLLTAVVSVGAVVAWQLLARLELEAPPPLPTPAVAAPAPTAS
jgi:hypothetical protein